MMVFAVLFAASCVGALVIALGWIGMTITEALQKRKGASK
jgi:hypothetical protein